MLELGIIFGGIAAIVALGAPLGVLARVTVAVAPFMVFIPGPTLPPVVMCLALVLGFRGLISGQRLLAPSLWTMGLSIVFAASSLWSVDPPAAFNAALYSFAVAGVVAAGSRLGAEGSSLASLVKVWLVSSSLLAMAAVVFRLRPEWEITYLRSQVAGFLAGHSAVRALFEGATNNALDPDKSGGTFLNGNSASAFLGVACMLSIWMAQKDQGRQFWALALLFGGAVLATGSKTGAMLLAVSLLLARIAATRGTTSMLKWLYCVVPVSLVGILLFGPPAPALVQSLGTRQIIWSKAVEAVSGNWLLGLGFGGWDEYFAPYLNAIGSASSYPPHNLVLNVWISAGIVAVVCLLGFIITTWRTLARWPDPTAAVLLLAFAWTVIHAMGDNTTLLNDPHTMPMLALVIGFGGYSVHEQSRSRRAERPLRPNRAVHR